MLLHSILDYDSIRLLGNLMLRQLGSILSFSILK